MVKFGSSDHIEQFAQGLLYMNTLKYFAEMEADALRKDSCEGTSHLWRGDGAILSVEVNGQFEPVGELRGPLRYRPDALQDMRVFCMYALRESAPHTLVDPRNFAFGDHCCPRQDRPLAIAAENRRLAAAKSAVSGGGLGFERQQPVQVTSAPV